MPGPGLESYTLKEQELENIRNNAMEVNESKCFWMN